MQTSDSAELIVQSVIIIAGICLVLGAFAGAVVTVWVQGRREDRLDEHSTRRYDRARRSLSRLTR